jgi:hypothetical protein
VCPCTIFALRIASVAGQLLAGSAHALHVVTRLLETGR